MAPIYSEKSISDYQEIKVTKRGSEQTAFTQMSPAVGGVRSQRTKKKRTTHPRGGGRRHNREKQQRGERKGTFYNKVTGNKTRKWDKTLHPNTIKRDMYTTKHRSQGPKQVLI